MTLAAPMPPTPSQVESLATVFLLLTREGRARRRWHAERRQCRNLLRDCRRPGYDGSPDVGWDIDWLFDLYTGLFREGDFA